MNAGDIVRVEINGMTHDGNGVGRTNGMVVFAKNAVEGDIADVKITSCKKRFLNGVVYNIVRPSEDRIMPDCKLFGKCGGCNFRNVLYAAELKYKTDRVRNAFRKITGIRDTKVNDCLACDKTDSYRNKSEFSVCRLSDGSISIGFLRSESYDLIEIDECKLLPDVMNRALKTIKEALELNIADVVSKECSENFGIHHIILRSSSINDDLMLIFISSSKDFTELKKLSEVISEKTENIKSVYYVYSQKDKWNFYNGAKLLYGCETIQDKIGDIVIKISPESFFQVNTKQAEVLYEKVLEFAKLGENDFVLDVYCGAGSIGLFLANKCREILGIETVAKAIKDAEENALNNNISNAQFICAKAEDKLIELSNKGIKADVVVLDPPRVGCEGSALEAITYIKPKRIVYVSCDPETLARDVKVIMEKGYEISEIQPVDMFPRTAHVETVCLLSKLNAKQHIEINLDMDELDLTDAEKKATYQEIKDYVLEHSGLKVSSLYIAQIRQKCGIIERENYNKPKSEDAKQPQCPPDKEKAIKEALQHFGMI